MNLPPRSRSMTQRLAELARLIGLGSSEAEQVLRRTATLALPFGELPAHRSGIGWQSGTPLQRLIDLPRGALSGPVQEDKAQAHATLKLLVGKQREKTETFDLRRIDGLCVRGTLADSGQPDFEALVASPECRRVRIISFSDFNRVLGIAIPGFERKPIGRVRQASWHGNRLFWEHESHAEEFASAVVYARRRGLEIQLPFERYRYLLRRDALNELERRYHMLAMPPQAWNDDHFMGLLLETGMPYARFGLFNTDTPESLMLQRQHPLANAFGEGLRALGAADIIAHLRQCQEHGDDQSSS
ncbi:MAG: hypothetical protein GAK36_00139 [Pseudomonas sp.]|nr:MAG: hypothetical protein GAK36_00139 [Pseudomonas sp.]